MLFIRNYNRIKVFQNISIWIIAILIVSFLGGRIERTSIFDDFNLPFIIKAIGFFILMGSIIFLILSFEKRFFATNVIINEDQITVFKKNGKLDFILFYYDIKKIKFIKQGELHNVKILNIQTHKKELEYYVFYKTDIELSKVEDRIRKLIIVIEKNKL